MMAGFCFLDRHRQELEVQTTLQHYSHALERSLSQTPLHEKALISNTKSKRTMVYSDTK